MGGEAVKRWRQLRGMTLSELARESGVSKGTISRLERGEIRSPRVETVERVAEALGVPGSVLFVEIARRPEGLRRWTSKSVARERCETRTKGGAAG